MSFPPASVAAAKSTPPEAVPPPAVPPGLSALTLSASQLQLVLDASKLGLWTWTAATDLVDFSPRAAEIFGIEPGPVMTWTALQKILHPEDREQARRAVDASIRERSDYDIEYRVNRPKGGTVWVAAKGRAVFSDPGELSGMHGVVEDITRHKANELQLRAQAVQLDMITRKARVMFAHCSRDRRFIYVNDAYRERLGMTSAHIVGRRIGEILGEAVEQLLSPYIERVLQGETVEFQIEVPYRFGKRMMHVTYVPDFAADRSVSGWLSTISDVTERHLTEAALRERSRTLEVINRAATTLVASRSLDGIVQTVTDAAREVSGAAFGAFFYNVKNERGEAYTLYTISGVPREEFSKFPMPSNTAMFGPTFNGEGVVRVADVRADPRYGQSAPHRGMPTGHLPVRSYLAVPVRSATGEVLGGLFFGHPDVGVFTADAEQAVVGLAAQAAVAIDNANLYTASRRLAAIVESSDDAILSTTLDGTLTTWNAGAERMFGFAAHEIIGKSILTLMPPDRQAEEAEILGRVARGERMEHYETVRQRRDGTKIDVSLSISPLKDQDGKITGASKIARDITLQKQAMERLEAAVDERTASLREAISQMEEFSYTVSHDLRSPARAMRGYTEVLLEDYGEQLDPSAREILERIMRASARMDRMIQDLLTYSRLTRREVQLERVSLDKLIREVIQQYPETQSNDADIVIVGELPDVLAHEPSLTQAVANLLRNAVKFVAPGVKPHVRVEAERRGRDVRLWVRDNGIGIRPEHHARVFGMFEQVHPEQQYEGTGIGLAIVRKAMDRMNGAAGVESDGRHGSNFWIQLSAAR